MLITKDIIFSNFGLHQVRYFGFELYKYRFEGVIFTRRNFPDGDPRLNYAGSMWVVLHDAFFFLQILNGITTALISLRG